MHEAQHTPPASPHIVGGGQGRGNASLSVKEDPHNCNRLRTPTKTVVMMVVTGTRARGSGPEGPMKGVAMHSGRTTMTHRAKPGKAERHVEHDA